MGDAAARPSLSRGTAGSATGLVHLTWSSAFRSNAGVVHGTRGSARIEDDHILVTTAEGTQRIDFAQKISAGSAHPDWFESMLPDFEAECRDAALRGRNLAEAATVLRLIAGARRSQLSGRLEPVELRETSKLH